MPGEIGEGRLYLSGSQCHVSSHSSHVHSNRFTAKNVIKTNIVLVLWYYEMLLKKELPMVCPEIPKCSLMLFWIYNDNDIDIFFQLALLI